MEQVEVKILNNRKINGSYFRLSFRNPSIAKQAKPGQFLEIRVSDGLKPFLRKPFGIHSVKDGVVEVLYEIVGEGTRILSEKKSGETLDIIGPLGNGFEYQGSGFRGQGSVLIAGGIGVAPLVFLAEKLTDPKTKKPKNQKTIVLIGARTKQDVLCETEFKKLGCEVKIATDDGSKHHKGFVTDLLNLLLRTRNWQLGTIYACGPKPMMKEAARIAARHNIPCQALLEEYMACGVGVCLGCAIMTKDGYKMVCKDGPVFDAGEVVWG